MAYTRVNWQNSPSHATPLSAENLNVMDASIASLDTAVTEAEGDISSLETEVGEQATTISGLQTTVQGHTASIGTLANLTTTEKSNLVGAINDVNEDVSDVKEDLADETTARESADTKMASEISDLFDMGTQSTYNNDKVPYLFRASGGGKYIGGIEKDTIVGGTVAWNQLADMDSLSGSHYAEAWASTITKENGKLKVASTRDYTEMGFNFVTGNLYVQGHKYLLLADIPKCSFTMTNSSLFIADGWSQMATGIDKTGVSTSISGVVSADSSGTSGTNQRMAIRVGGTVTTGDYIEVTNAVLTDLTQMFGSTIADYIYSLEQANTGAGVAKLKSWGFFTEDYYEYDSGSLKSVEGLVSHDMVGFNQFNKDASFVTGKVINRGGEEANNVNCGHSGLFEVVPNAQYYVNWTGIANTYGVVCYDSEKNPMNVGLHAGTASPQTVTIPTHCKYVALNVPLVSLESACFNLSSSRNGTYEPYEKHSYPLDSDLTLRGIPKLDSANNLYYDGDTYESDGTVTRKYGTRAYQSGDESLTDAITDGTTTVYKLSTPTTETADPYQNPQIVDKYGTEEYVTTGIVPVGHDTEYYLDADSVLTPPSTAGTYSLKVTVASDGSKSYSWVSD